MEQLVGGGGGGGGGGELYARHKRCVLTGAVPTLASVRYAEDRTKVSRLR